MRNFVIFIAILLVISLSLTVLATKKDDGSDVDTEATTDTATDDTSGPATESDRELITFYIDGQPQVCVKGTTWRELIEDSLLILSGVRNVEGYVGTGNEGSYLVYSPTETEAYFLRVDDPVIENARYSEIDSAVYEDGLGVFYLDSEPIPYPIGYTWRQFVDCEHNLSGLFSIYEKHLSSVVYGSSDTDFKMVCYEGDAVDNGSVIIQGGSYTLSEDPVDVG